MSDQEINTAIAEECGWTKVFSEEWGPLRGLKSGDKFYAGCAFTTVPDYCNDLNAIRDAVMTLPENKQVLYGVRLAWACGHTDKGSVGLWKISTATARQRAEAFLRTLGKWKETK
jgi:hypothetical protein